MSPASVLYSVVATLTDEVKSYIHSYMQDVIVTHCYMCGMMRKWVSSYQTIELSDTRLIGFDGSALRAFSNSWTTEAHFVTYVYVSCTQVTPAYRRYRHHSYMQKSPAGGSNVTLTKQLVSTYNQPETYFRISFVGFSKTKACITITP